MSANIPLKTTTTEKFVMNGKQDAVHAISKWLNEGDELDRCCACQSLGALGDHASTESLVDHLQDEDIDVCIDAAEALGRIGDTRAVTPLLASLHNDLDNDVKTIVVQALGQLGGEQAISQLMEFAISPPEDDEWDDDEAWDSNWDIQIEAVRALGRLRATSAVSTLRDLLNNSECQVDKSDVFNALAHIGGEGEQVLIQHLQEDVPRERRRAARALGLSCSAIGARALGRALQDQESEVRTAAADALASSSHDHYLGALLLLLRDPSDEVRETALRAVNKLTTNNTTTHDIELEKFLPLLDDASPQVRAATLKILHGRATGISNEHTLIRIQELLEDPNPIVAAAACPFAFMLNNSKVEQTLLSIAKNQQTDSTVRQQAILALGQRGNASGTILMALTEILNTHDAVISFAALQALLALHTHEANTSKESINKDIDDETLPTPLEIILAALRGEIISPADIDQDSPEPEPKEINAVETTTDSNEVDASNDTVLENADLKNTTLENISPISTLDSIALGNAELAQQFETSKALNPDETPDLSPEEMEIFQPYYNILQQQKYSRKKFTRKKTVNIVNEVRRLSARVLGECSEPEIVKALTQAIHDENPEIQREAINALTRLAPDTSGITEILGPLTSFLHLGNIDLRIASAKALAALGNLGTLPNLLECLEDENLLVRNQVVLAVAQILKSYASHSTSNNKLSVSGKHIQEEVTNIKHALRSLIDRLDDIDTGVRKVTTLAISELNELIMSDEFHDEVIERLISAGFTCEGAQARDMGIALRKLDPANASNRLISLLNNSSSSYERRFAMEMLEEVFRPAQTA